MKKITTGVLAHVDAGKTTLSEGMLYTSGAIRALGRVDNQNTFLDTDEIERKRGITVFSKQAVLSYGDMCLTMLDTPGHVDFSAETERTLQVLDYAILVISGTDGIQSHTQSLWQLLKKYNIPVFVFVNKLDLEGADKKRVIDELNAEFGSGFVDFKDTLTETFFEEISLCDEKIMNQYLEEGAVSDNLISRAIRLRNVFPCIGGSALKMDGVKEFLDCFSKYTLQSESFPVFGAKVYKIAQDDKGQRVTFMKVTGGSLKVKEVLKIDDSNEKINEIRIYSGEKYQCVNEVDSGTVCAATGLAKTYSGQGLGFECDSDSLTAEPIFNYRVVLPKNADAGTVLAQLKQLEEEETQLNVVWNEHLREIQIRMMGEIQLEVLKHIILKRFDLNVEFEEGGIVYKETIENTVEGVGHYEPLRHYAEVHLLIEPLKRGTGVLFATDCPEDDLDKNWQRLIMTHLMEKTHLGVLTGSPITDVKITLKAGKAHLKHTESGDFRQATYRAVRQGLRQAKSILLEPYYEFVVDVPNENVGKLMTDLDVFGAQISSPVMRGNMSKITGTVSAAAIKNYQRELVSYTHGKGKLVCRFSGYEPCKKQTEIVEKIAYDCDRDVENTADSVFCSHGAGFAVRWDEVHQYMHIDSILKIKKEAYIENAKTRTASIAASDAELMKIFERTYGKIERKNPNTVLNTPKSLQKPYKAKNAEKKFDTEYLLVDGYNIIFAWDDLRELAKESLDAARNSLIDRISAYKVFRGCEVIVVFDAYKVKGNRCEVENVLGVSVVYTKEAQTADSYIEKTARELSRNYKVTVATSDGLEQLIIFGSGAFRLSAKAFMDEVVFVEENVREIIHRNNFNAENTEFLSLIREKLEEAKPGCKE